MRKLGNPKRGVNIRVRVMVVEGGGALFSAKVSVGGVPAFSYRKTLTETDTMPSGVSAGLREAGYMPDAYPHESAGAYFLRMGCPVTTTIEPVSSESKLFGAV